MNEKKDNYGIYRKLNRTDHTQVNINNIYRKLNRTDHTQVNINNIYRKLNRTDHTQVNINNIYLKLNRTDTRNKWGKLEKVLGSVVKQENSKIY